MSQRFLVNSHAVLTQGRYCAFQIYGIPECNGRDDQIQAAGAIALVLEAALRGSPWLLKKTPRARAFLASHLLRPTWTRLRSARSFIHSSMKRERLSSHFAEHRLYVPPAGSIGHDGFVPSNWRHTQ